jgi:hypothetical protein
MWRGLYSAVAYRTELAFIGFTRDIKKIEIHRILEKVVIDKYPRFYLVGLKLNTKMNCNHPA